MLVLFVMFGRLVLYSIVVLVVDCDYLDVVGWLGGSGVVCFGFFAWVLRCFLRGWFVLRFLWWDGFVLRRVWRCRFTVEDCISQSGVFDFGQGF